MIFIPPIASSMFCGILYSPCHLLRCVQLELKVVYMHGNVQQEVGKCKMKWSRHILDDRKSNSLHIFINNHLQGWNLQSLYRMSNVGFPEVCAGRNLPKIFFSFLDAFCKNKKSFLHNTFTFFNSQNKLINIE